MKTERLYAITVYLMNHGKTSAAQLAEKFGVSVRTIQRDIDSLCHAGIPIFALNGSNGGYQIMEQFVMNNQLLSQEEFAYILTALKGLSSVSGNLQLADISEKILALTQGRQTGMILDFSVLREGDAGILQNLQSAVRDRKRVSFTYTNNEGKTRRHLTEPIAVMYQWYAWYLLAYSVEKQDYRTYKLVRMENLEVMNESFCKEHPVPETVLQENNRRYSQCSLTKITLKCRQEAAYRLKEYLNARPGRKLPDGMILMELSVIETEQWWIGIILSLGDAVEILSPTHIKERIVSQSEKILKLYKNI